MKLQRIRSKLNIPYASSLLFLFLGICCIGFTFNGPIRDFGNYYYGSRLLLDGKFTLDIYTGLHYFNQQVSFYGEKGFFGNYIPVPPFTALIYTPFYLFNPGVAKVIFNLTGLLFFCRSFYRLLLFTGTAGRLNLLAVPFVFLLPLFHNLSQGQSYLFVIAFLIEAFILSTQGKVILPSLFIALSISLKIFPVFVLFFYLLNKNYRIFACTICMVLLFFLLPLIFIAPEIVTHYVSHVLPRLFNNDVIGPYYPGNQSTYTALLNLFSYDQLHNPFPLGNNKFLIILTDSLFSTIILVSAFASLRKDKLLGYSIFLFAGILISRYATSYSLILLVPIGIYVCLSSFNKTGIILLAILFLSVSVPVIKFIDAQFVLKYSRLIGLLITFFILIFVHRLFLPKPYLYLSFVLVLFVVKYFTFPIKACNYFYIQNTTGVLTEVRPGNNHIRLVSTIGMKDTVEVFSIKGKATHTPGLIIKNNQVCYNTKMLSSSNGNKKDPFIYNDTCIVFMSDLNQAVGFYKLMVCRIPK